MDAPMPEQMNEMHEIVALLVARGCTNQEISDATGYNPNYVWRIKNEVPGFDALVAEFKREIQERVIDQTVDAITMLNRKVPDMINNLEDLALNAKKEGVRLRGTMDWLDSAPDAPKRVHRQELAEERTITFAVSHMDNIKGALTDVGANDVVELLEGEDFKIEETDKVLNVDDD